MDNICNPEDSNEVKEIQLSILKENLANLNTLIDLRKELAMLELIHPRLGATAQFVNAGRIREVKARVKQFEEATEGV